MNFRTKIVWEKQDYETIELVFDLEGDSRTVGTAFVVENGKAGVDPNGPVGSAGKKLTEAVLSLVARARADREDLIRLIVNQVGDGLVVAIYGSPAKSAVKAMDIDDEEVRMDMVVAFEAALAFADWKGLDVGG
jgi:hypothetical protein